MDTQRARAIDENRKGATPTANRAAFVLVGLVTWLGSAAIGCDSSKDVVGRCTEAEVVEAARRVTLDYCAGPNGCHFNPRLDDAGTGTDPTTATWIVIVSLIHSYDDAGMPRFMPDGARVVRVATDCTATHILGPQGPVPMPDPSG